MGVARVAGIIAGTAVILGIGLYGPATLLAPLPEATLSEVPLALEDAASPPALPTEGASALTAGAEAEPFATAGDDDALPMAGIAKVVTALVVLDSKPMNADDDGENVPITSADFLMYNDYKDSGARVVTVYTADTWSERAVLQAMLLGSSNNHSDTLAAWAFGSVDEYVTAANAWLAEHGLTGKIGRAHV